MRFLPRPFVAGLAIVLALGIVLAAAPRAAAAQNRPSWTAGDYWIYTRTAGGETSTVRVDVVARESITLTSDTYAVWRTTETTTTSDGDVTVTATWYEEGTLAVVKTNFTFPPFLGEVQVTYDPPRIEATFPLQAGSSWSLNTTLEVVGIAFSLDIAYSGAVVAEQSTGVPAGTFSVAVVRTPSTASTDDTREEKHYSDGAGNNVKEESYNGSGERVSNQELTSYRYQSGSLLLILLVVGGLIVAAIVVGAIVTIRRRRMMRPPGTMPPGAVPPPPFEPPQAPPPGT